MINTEGKSEIISITPYKCIPRRINWQGSLVTYEIKARHCPVCNRKHIPGLICKNPFTGQLIHV